jgi:putative transposase
MARHEAPEPFSEGALLRYHVVSLVRARLLQGWERPAAVQGVAALEHPTARGGLRRVSARSLYRWLARFEAGGMAALEGRPRAGASASRVLAPKLLSFLAEEREADPAASIPERLRRAKENDLLASSTAVDRTTAYRALVRMGVPTGRTHQERGRDMRRFAYAHRMQMVLCDGKHFRAGAQRAKRVALFFLDDSTRMGLGVVVGTSESAGLFLEGFAAVLRAHGLMGILYLDQGSGFVANAVAEVCRRLGNALVHGASRYPEGHGKIERFHRTAEGALLRALDGRPDVDPGPEALALRLAHWLIHTYNHQPHEGLARFEGRFETPYERWSRDPRRLRHVTDATLRNAFVLYHERSVSRDRIVSIEGVRYELPRALAPSGRGRLKVTIQERLLGKGFYVLCPDGAAVRIAPVDLAANATAPRAPREAGERPRPRVRTAADMTYERDLGPVVDADGGVPEPEPEPDSERSPP